MDMKQLMKLTSFTKRISTIINNCITQDKYLHTNEKRNCVISFVARAPPSYSTIIRDVTGLVRLAEFYRCSGRDSER